MQYAPFFKRIKNAGTQVAVLVVAVLLSSALPVFSETGADQKEPRRIYLYEWTDDRGILHITDGLGKIPEQYRSKARKVESQQAPEVDPEQQRQSGGTPHWEAEQREADKKAEWRQRFADWKERLAGAERSYRQLERQRDELFAAWGSAALAPIETRIRAEEIERRMQGLREEIETARNMIEQVIPEEARKAGIPPGWLRE